MTKIEKHQVGSFGWTHSNQFSEYRAEDEAIEEMHETCWTCKNPVTNAHSYWYCDENGEVVHGDCEIPDFDTEEI